MADNKDDKTKKGLLRTIMYPLEKRLLLDASTLEATVNAIPNGVLNLDAQDIDGDGDFSAGDQPTTGTTVQNWEDKFGGDNDASENTASRRAQYDANAFGTGIGGLVFDGDDTYNITNESNINVGGTWPEKSFAAVFRTGADTSGFQIVYEQGGSIRGYQISIDDGNIYAAGFNNTGSEWGSDRFKIMNLGAVQANTTYRVIMVFDANTGLGSIKANLNGGTFVQLDEVGAQPAHSGNIGIGSEQGGTVRPTTLALTNNTDVNFFKGAIGQIMLWNTALDDTQVRAVDSYLTHKWTNSPSIQFNTGDTVLEGGTTNISSTELYTVDRNTGPNSLTYQITNYSNGVIERSGVALGINGTFTQADIDSGIIFFAHDDSETVTANFSYRVTDGGTQDTDTFYLNVTPVDDIGDDPPAITNNTTQTVVESASVNIASGDLFVTDVDTAAINLNFTVTSTLNGSVFNTALSTTVTSFTQEDINNGFIRFDHDGTINGFAGFDFDVTDGTTTISGIKDIGVTFPGGGGNDPPVIVVNTGDSVNTGGSRSISNVNLRTADSDNSINQLVYTITSVSNGTVFRNGVALAINGTFTQEDVNFGLILFTHDGSATATASIGFDVSDGTTTVAGNSYDFGVVTNDPPDIGPDPAPINVLENAADGTLIYTATATDTDGDSITYTIESGNGLGIFQINPINGALTIADNTNLNFEGTNSFSLVIRATDDGVGTPFDELTLTINVQNVNEAPIGTDNSITTPEDTDYIFSAADFGFTDPNDIPSNALQSVVITTLPATGVLNLSGVAVTAGQEILAADIPNLTFTPVANENGAGYDSFTFQVRDDGGTANSGSDLDSTPNTMSIDVTSVNDAPDGADITLSTLEDTPLSFAAGDFGFTDVNDAPDNFNSVIITTLPADGLLELSGVAVTLGQEILVADIPNLTFTPSLNDNGVGYTSFTFQVRDDGATPNGGQDIDQTANTVTIDVTSVNDAPDGADNTVTTLEDSVLSFAAGDFGFSDIADAPNNFQSVVITTLPATGLLELSGVAITAGQEILLADIPNITFTPVAGENGTGYADFTFQVRDDGGTTDGGIDLDGTPNTMTIDVTSVNDAPDGADITLSTLEDTPLSFTAANFGFTDANDTPANNLQSIIITTLPADGVLELSGVAVTPGQEILVADIPNLSFIGAANEFGVGYTDFTFQVRDDGTTTDGGQDTDQTANTVTIDITSVNDEPDGADATLSVLENNIYTFAAADFGYSDVNDAPNNFQSVFITTLPATGALELSGVAVTPGQEILVADIPNLTFTPVANENGVGYTDFTFQVRDDGGTPNGGQDTDQTANTITFDVDPINSEPLGADNTVTTLEDTDYIFSAADFGFTDPNDIPSNALQSVVITTLPATGVLNLSGVAVTAGQEILAADIPNLTFTPVANENGAGYDSFTFQVRDDGGTANSGSDLDSTPNTMSIDVTSVNDAPDGADITLSTLEDTPLSFAAGDFGFTDVNDAPDNFNSVIITTLPADGLLELSGVAVTLGQEILVADIPNLTFTPSLNDNGVGYTSFTFQVRDDGATPNGGQDIDQTANTVTIDVTSVNDAPDGADNTVTTLEDSVLSFAAGDFGFSDIADAPNNFQSVVITTLPATGLLELSGVAITAGQEILLADIPNITFTPVAGENGTGYADFTFQVRDDGGTTDGGIDLDGTPNTMTIDVTSVNDAPDGADITLSTLEDTPLSFTAANFGFTDANDTPANNLQSIIITTLPADGVLELSGVAVTPGQEILVADIPNLSFIGAANEFGVGYTDFTFQVRDDGTTTDGGQDTDQTANTVTIDITSVNDEPDGADATLSVLENNIYTFAAADFGYSDVNDAPNNFQSVFITTLPATGALELSGVAVTPGQEILVADIPNLTFTPVANENGVGYTDFTFQVRDDGGTPNGGQDTDQTANTITFDVDPINSEPLGADNTVTTLEDTDYIFSAADFGFTDPNDIPSNALQSVVITTLPATGVLNLSGVAVTAGQEILAADIPNLTFTPVANENGAGYDSFTFQVRDDGGTANSGSDLDSTPNTMSIDVTSVNDAPDGADITLSTLEDTPLSFAAGDFGFTDVNDAPDNFNSVIITTLPADGLLELSGVAVTLGQEILVADIPNLTFTPSLNDNGVGYTSFTFQVRDDGATPNGGQDIDQTANTVTIDVTSVNDAPDGADNTVTTLEDSVLSFAAGDFGFSDIADAPNNFQSVVITTLPATGLLELSGVAITAGQEILLADIPNITFTPVAGENGTGYADFTFQVRDDGGTTDGGIDLDGTPNTMTIDVTSVNDAPDGADITLSTLEDTPLSFTAANFGFTDANDTPANNLQSIIITTLPADGVLELSGVAVTPGQEILVADIPNLSFIGAANEFGVGYTDFTFQVRDDGTTTDGGQDTDQTANTVTIDITSVNDEPDGADATLSVLENNIYTFAAADFGYSDVNDAPNNFQSVFITTLPATGALELSGVAVTPGQEILVADIPNLTFTPVANENGVGYTDFTFQVRDDGGTPNGGQDTDQTANTITFDVDPINSEPLGADNTVTTLEDTDYIFSAADFGFTDPNDIPSNALQSVVITTLPATGVLNLSGVAVTAGQEILAADIPNLTFTPVANENGAGYDSFTFQVRDDGGTANSGSDLDSTPNTMSIDVTSVNDAPDGADITLSTLEDTPLSFAAGDFGFTDVNDAPDNFNSVIITTLPADGLLELSGVAVTLGQEILVADIPNLTFTPSLNDNGVGYTSFTFQVRDDGATPNGGQDIDQTANTVTIDVTSVNDAPDGADNTVTTLEDSVLSFAAGDFGFSDIADAPNNFQSVVITTLPATGLLELSGVAITAGQEILLADIPNITFTPVAGENGTGYADFTFQVRDDGGTTDGGIDLDGTPNTMTIDVTSVNDAPDGADITLSTLEDTPLSFTAANFGFTDANDTPANNLQSIIITTLPADGVLELSGVAVTPGQEILVADIPNLSFIGAANEFGVGYTDFTFQVRDDGTTTDGGQDTDQTANTVTIDITSVNDEPDGADATLSVLENNIYTFAAADFGYSDVNDAPNNFQSVFITTLPATGALELSGVAVTPGQEILVADIPNLTFTPVANENGVGYTDFTFQVRDDGGTPNGGQDTDQTANTITFDVDPINSEPLGADNTVTTLEDTDYIFSAADFGFTDPNDIPSNALQSVVITTLPATGVLNLSGVAVTAGQEILAADIPNLTFTPVANENGAGYDSFTFQVRDDGGTANSGSDLDSTPNTMSIDVTSVNDAPDGADITLSTLEDTPLSFAAGDFGFTDVNDAPDNFNSVIITTLPADGLLELSGVAVTLGQEILVADIPNLTFTPSLNDNGVGYTSFTFQVRDDGATPNGGQDIDQTANTVTIDVTSVNDAPDGADNTVTTLEDSVLSFAAGDFGFSDIADAPNNFQSVVITTLPATGLLELSGVAITAGQEILLADIPNITFTPVAGENGTGYADFTFQVRDDGGTTDGGIDLDGTPNTMTIDVTSVNDAPDGADITLSTLEDTPLSFTAANFGFTDANDTPANNLQSIIITTLPADGVLELSGVAVTPGQEILVADIPNLSFIGAANEFGVGYTDFTFQVRDDGTTTDGGQDTDQTANTVTIDITSVNDEPDGADATLSVLENNIYTFAAADFGYSDVNDAPNNFQSVFITTLPATGALELSGVAVTPGQEILVADIPNLTFTPVANENGVGYTDFTFQVRDDGGTPNGGQDTDQTANTITFDVDPINSEPLGADNTVTTLEDTDYIFSAADFGFTDPNDIPSNALQSVVITTLPATGVLNLSGVAVTAGQEILAADIPNLTFTPVANENGAGYDSFTFQVRDDGGTANSGSDLDSTPNTMSIDVTSVNDAPDGADITLSTLEDTPLSFAAGDFGFTDVNDAPDNFNSVIITTLPADGLLELSGVAVTLGQEILVADIPNLTFTPSLNDNGVGYTSFTFQVRDDGATPNGGQDIDQTANTVTIDVTSVNDAPDGADNTVTTLEDSVLSFAAGDFGFSDIADAPNNFQSVVITTLPATGLLELSGVAITAGQEILLADIPNITFTPVAGENGTGYADFTFQVRDDGGTTDGGIDLDGTPNTMTIDVTSVNDAPDGTDTTLITNEDIPYIFSAGDFGYSDPNDSPPNNFDTIIITTLPIDGVIEFSGVAVTAGQSIAISDISNLTYTPTLNEFGTGYSSFSFQVRDDGGTTNGGQDTDQSPNTITFDVLSVNDEPDGTDNTVTTLEDTDYVFNAIDFGYSDINDAPNNFQSVVISTLPVDGILNLSGVAVTAGQEILVADIPNLTFSPLSDANGLGYADFTFQVRDDGGTLNGGINLDQTANTMTIDVTPVDDAPILVANNPITVLEGDTEIIDISELATTDIDTDDNDIIYNVTTPPTNGFLALTSAPLVPILSFTQDDIANNLVTYVHNNTPTTTDSFEFTVQDATTVLATETFDITIITVNDAPEGSDNTLTTLEDTPLTFSPADFGFSDPADLPSNSLQSVVITTLPADGILELSGVAVTTGQEILAADIPNLTFTPSLNDNGVGYTSFTFQVRDDGGTASGGIDLDASPNIMTIDVTSVNDAPDGTDTIVTALEDTDYIFSAADFGFTDVDDIPANNLQSVIIATIPTTGTLNLSGVAVTAGQEILIADIPNLIFTPIANENGASYDNFTFQVRDDGGTADGGIDLDAIANTITIDVASINDAPEGTDNTLTTLEDTPYTFDPSDFGLNDPIDSPANNLQSVVITTLPADGVLELSGVAVTAGQEITFANIPNLTFLPTVNEFGAGYANFTFQVRDDGGTADGGIDLDPTPNMISFDVTEVNDAPEGTDNTLTTLEDTPYTFAAADFGFTDLNDAPADNFNSVYITTLPADGLLELSGVAVTAGQEILLADIPNLTYTPPLNDNGVGYTNFTFQVRDDAGVADGGIDTDQTPNIITMDVTPVDDAPTLDINGILSTFEGFIEPITTAELSSSDIDSPATDIIYTITTPPTNGQVELTSAPGFAITSFTQDDLDNNRVVYAHDSTNTTTDSFDFEVSDATTNIGASTFNISITPVNDAPIGTDNALVTNEDTSLNFTANDFGFTDPGDTIPNNFQSVVITTLPPNGTLELSGVAVTAGQEILVADIPNLFFVPVPNENGLGYGNFTFQVRDDGGTAGGGVDLDPTPKTLVVDVTSVNDVPEGADNTITFLENDVFTFAGTDFGFTDVNDTPADILNSVVITTIPTVGTLELSGIAVTAGQEILAADIPNLTYTSVPNGNGIGYDNFTFQVRDNGGTTNGGIDLDATPNTITFDVESVNSAPYGTDTTLTTLEDTQYIFNASDFGFSDPDDVPSDNLQSVIITTLPIDGVLELSGVAVTAGQNISLADIPNLTFTPNINENGAGYTSFTFQVVDNGETVNGVNTDQSPNIITFDVTAVNDAPDGTDITLTTLEDTPLNFTAGDFGFTDTNDTPTNNLQSVIITTIPTNGVLELSGIAVTAGQEILTADIPNLTFTPALNDNGAGYDNFTFLVRDDGGTANGGIDLDTAPNTITIDVTSVNDAPDGIDNTVTTLEDTGFIFNPTDFGLTDNSDIPANNLASIIVTTLPTNGVLELSGIAVTAGQEILASDIPNLVFTPAANDFGAGYDNFTFQVRDDGGTIDGGFDLDSTPNTMTIDVTPVNDEPDGTDNTLTTLEDTPLGFVAADFGFIDPIDIPTNNFQSIFITTIPSVGILELSGVAVTNGQEILITDLPNLFYIPALNDSGLAADSFTFQVRDDGGTLNGGLDTDQTPNALTIDITAVNEAPDGTDNTVTALEDTPYIFTGADFGFTDVDDVPANNLASIIITTLPINGALELSGVAVTAGQEILVTDLPNLAFTAISNEYGTSYADFTFQVRDDGGTANGGVDLDPTPNTLTIDVTEVNDAPNGADITISTLEDTPVAFTPTNFGFTDVSDTPSDNFQSIIITTLPTNGTLELSGVAVTAGQEILVADIPNLVFNPAANEFGANYTDFTFQVRDDGGTPNGGIDIDTTPNTVTLDVISVNDAPTGTDNTVTALEDTPLTFTSANFGFTDPDDSIANNFDNIIITTIPTNGTFTLSGTAITAGQIIAVTDIPNIIYTPNLNINGVASDGFTFQVQDDGGTVNGGIDLDPTPNAISIDVTSINDEPDGTDNTVTTLEDVGYAFNGTDFGLTDINDTPTNNLASVIITTLPTNGVLELSGVSVTAGQEILAADIPNLIFTPDANDFGAGYDSFTFQVRDDDGTTNGGIDLDSTPNTMTIDVTPVNDAPNGADITLTTLEDTTLTFNATDFGFTDIDDVPSNNFQALSITTLPSNGILELSGIPVTTGQTITVADIPNLTFTPALNGSGLGYDNFAFAVIDDGGTTDGGIDTDQTPNFITIDVTPVNDAPQATDNTVTALEDTDYTFNAADFGFTDINDVPANNLQSITINTLPVSGSLSLFGIPVTSGQIISVADIPNLTFSPLANENGANYANFNFQVTDDGGILNGGIDTDATPNTMTIDVTSINDAPAGADNTLSTLEDIPYTFNSSDFGFSDTDDVPANNLQSIVLTTLPADGVLELSGVAVIAGQEILAADIPNLTFTPALNDNGVAYTNFTFQVRDDDGTSNGGINTDQTPNTITFDVVAVDDIPILDTNNGLTLFEGGTTIITTSDLSSSDVDTLDSDILYTITTAPINGQLEFTTNPGVAIVSFTQADLASGRVTYTHNGTETTIDSFDFELSDLTTNIGSANFTITVTPANDAPVGSDNTAITNEDTNYVFNVTDFNFTDPNDTVPNNLQAVRIVTLPLNGTLSLATGSSASGPITVGQYISVADIPFLTFTPDADENGNNYGNFNFQLQDDGGTVGTGVDLSDTYTMRLDVTPINDAPHDLTLSSTFLPEGISTWNIGKIKGFDIDSNLLTYSIVSANPEFSITNGNILTINGAKTFGVDPNTYSVTLRVNDGALTYDETFTITLMPEVVNILNHNPADVFSDNPNNNISNTTGTQKPQLEYYIRDFMKEIQNGNIFRYGNQGLIDSSLSISDNPMKDAFYGRGDNGVDEIIKRNVIVNLQELAAKIMDDTGVDVTTEQLAEIFGLDVILLDMQDPQELEEPQKTKRSGEIIYETNAIYKALVSLNNNSIEDNSSDEIADKRKINQREYLHRQLDEAALYYQSKNVELTKALGKNIE